jgi:hypothetical protein
MSYSTPPPPPPPAPASAPAGGGAPWYKTPAGLFGIGVIVAAAIAIPVLFIVFRGGGNETAGGTSTTVATTTTAGSSTTGATTSSSTTTSATTTSSSTSSTTTTTTTTTTTPPSGDQLDYTLDPNYEEFDLASGFLPDPDQHTATSGGAVDVSYLGGGCVGFVTPAPDFRLNYTAASSSLRFYFVADNAGDDTTLIINDPSGNWYCGDDSYGTADPTVDFTGAAPSGTYDIWIGSYDAGTYHDGTLNITELDSNHP